MRVHALVGTDGQTYVHGSGIAMPFLVHRDAILSRVRTTIRLDDDVAAAVDRVRRERGLGLSNAVNELIRAGLGAGRPRRTFRQRSKPIGLRVDVTNVAEAVELLDGPGAA